MLAARRGLDSMTPSGSEINTPPAVSVARRRRVWFFLGALRLPPRVAAFYARAYLYGRRRDPYSVRMSARPEDVSRLLALAKGRRYVVELGTGVGWTSIAFALADRRRDVVTYDPVEHPAREHYLRLAADEVRARIRIRPAPAASGPAPDDPPVEFLFIDIGGHHRADTAKAFLAWRGALAPGAVVVFHDYTPEHPGVSMAVAQLGLEGQVTGRSLFVWRFP
jgi:DNA-binding transcriptional LysR family regulator